MTSQFPPQPPAPPAPPGIPGFPGMGQGMNLPPALAALLGALLLLLMSSQPAATQPPAPSTTPPPPPPPPPAPPVVAGPTRRIVGGGGEITGATKDGPLGPRIPRDRLDRILAGDVVGPNDTRLEFDITPVDQFGHSFQPDDPSWREDRQPGAPGAPEPIRLHFTVAGDGDADLVHEYANFGCSPRIRVRVPKGSTVSLANIYAEGPDYRDGSRPAVIEVLEGPITFGE